MLKQQEKMCMLRKPGLFVSISLRDPTHTLIELLTDRRQSHLYNYNKLHGLAVTVKLRIIDRQQATMNISTDHKTIHLIFNIPIGMFIQFWWLIFPGSQPLAGFHLEDVPEGPLNETSCPDRSMTQIFSQVTKFHLAVNFP